MVKCLIRIKTKVNVHLHMINHCYRDVKVRVLSMGPRLVGKALGILPLFPALPGGSSTSGSSLGSGQNSRTPSRLSVPPLFPDCSWPQANCEGKNLRFCDNYLELWSFLDTHTPCMLSHPI